MGRSQLGKKFEKLEAPKYTADEIHVKLVNSEPDEVPFDSLDEICSICALPIKDFVPDYCVGEMVNSACSHCKDDSYKDPFFSFPSSDIPPSLASHWILPWQRSHGNLGTITSLKAHYITLPNPRDEFIHF